MNLTYPSAGFDEAVSEVCHGTATEAQLRALNELLRNDPNAVEEYLFRIELHSRLASDPDLFSSPETQPAETSAQIIRISNHSPAPSSGGLNTRFTKGKFTASRALALAACLALIGIGVVSFLFKKPAARTGTTSAAVAMLMRAVEAQWAIGGTPLRVGSALAPGLVNLESGMVQIVFYSGARVVVEGPATLQLVSPKEAVCLNGRLLADIPEPARGFRVRTEHMDVVDLGTSFGIDASPGKTEVHVFKGKVELLPENSTKQLLGEGQAAVVQSKARPQLIAASMATFTSLFEFQKLSLASEAVRYDQWRLWNEQLNKDKSLLVHLDFENLDGADGTLHNAAWKNGSAQDAAIVGCQKAEGRWREKQALEFQSVNDRVRMAVAGEWDALTLSTWVSVKGLDRQFNSIFMCDGFNAGTVHWLIRNDGVLGLTVIGSEPGKFQIAASPPVLSLDNLGMWLHLAVVLDGNAKTITHYVNGVIVSEKPLKIPPPFRVGDTELGNWNSSGFPGNDPGLIRNFSGAMDEFCLFNRALDAGEIRSMYTQGRPESPSMTRR